MKTLIRITAVAVAVLVAGPAMGQSRQQRRTEPAARPQPQQQEVVQAEPAPQRAPRHDPPPQQNNVSFGLGVGLTSSKVTGGPDTGMLLYVPIQMAAGRFTMRVEPFIGWARYDIDQSNQVNDTAGFEPVPAGKGSDFTLGVGGFLVFPLVQQLQAYGGGRLASQWQSFKQTGFKQERRNTLLALAGGAEYLPIPRVALGAEFQIGYIMFGDTKFSNNAGSVETHGGSGTATQATLFARFFLF